MSLQSMTGFARVEGHNDIARWSWEVRSVNGKGLDFRLRVPHGMDGLQLAIRKRLSAKFSRGNLQINLVVESDSTQSTPIVNQPNLDAVLGAIRFVQKNVDCTPSSAAQILGIKGVLEQGSDADASTHNAEFEAVLLGDFDKLVVELGSARTDEGKAVTGFLTGQLDQIEKLKVSILADPSLSLENIKSRLSEQVSRLLDNTSGLDLDRLHQEAAILATKADLSEELDRLRAHIRAARDLLAGKGPVGRKLDFLCQEFNRECNTICSKSNAASVTANGLDMKVIIDQFREQVQNLE